MSTPLKRYSAFVSYSHADYAAAQWLHRTIETYRLPRTLRHATNGDARRADRLRPVFLDSKELASSSDLAASVRDALATAESLIVICSPAAAKSRWVNEEVRAFKELGRAERILCLVVGGEPRMNAGEGEQCFPPALRFQVVDGQITNVPAAEPLAADIRSGASAKRDAKLRIIAALLQVPFDDLRRREQARRQQRLVALAAVSVAVSVVFASLTLLAWRARNEAEFERQMAVRKTLTAERTAEFMVSLFEVADPSEARGNSITAREILDRGAKQIATGLLGEPLVRSELSATLGRVYYGLGLYGPASELLTAARSVAGRDPRAMALQSIALGDIEWGRGNYPLAADLYKEVDKQAGRDGKVDAALHARALVGLGDSVEMQGHFVEANALFATALAIADTVGSDLDLRARVLESMARTEVDSDRLSTAGASYTKALDARVHASGATHPKVLDILNDLGAIAYFNGDAKTAESYWVRLLDVDRRVLGAQHPEVAVTLNNLGRVRVEQQRYKEALPLLSEALAIQLAQRDEGQDDLIFALSNLALAKIGLQRLAEGETLLTQALRAAKKHKHRLEGPILTDIAALACRTHRYALGLKYADAARPLVAARYVGDPWRTAYIDNVNADCLGGLGRYRTAERQMASSLPVVLKKWPAATKYGHDALARAIRLYTRAGDAARVAQYSAMLQGL